MADHLPQYPQFDCKSEGRSIRWSKWVSRLKNNVFVAYNIDNDRRQKALLLTYGGDDLNDIVDSLPAESLVPGADETHLGKLEAAITAYFNPQANVEFQRYAFRHLYQKTDSIDDFYNELKQVAVTCNFTGQDDVEIKSQMITGCKSSKVREKGLSTPGISLADLLQYARTLELTKSHSKQIETSSTVNRVQYTQPKSRKPKPRPKRFEHKPIKQKPLCRNCGREWPHEGGQKNCPAFGKTCRKCGKLNHFDSVCFSKNMHSTTKSTHVNNVVESDTSDDSYDEYVFHATDMVNKLPYFQVTVNDMTVCALADSGASVNILPEAIYNKLINKPDLSSSSTRIYSYGKQSELPVIGTFLADLAYGDTDCTAPVCVVKGNNEILLGWNTCQELKLLSTVNTVQNNTEKLTDEYKYLFTGLGKLKGFQVKLHIDKEVQPVAQRYRRVPFHVRKDIEEQIKRDEELGVIEKATGPTPWVSPLVVFPKPNSPGQVRVCVDMRSANKAIKRERHVTPTLDEITSMLAGATVYSKIDLNQAYNQLEITEDSRYITTFATHLGLYRYKRLNFGINSAAEVFQETIRQALDGLNGVVNSSDDILVFGRTQEDHDRNLRELFERLRERGLTIKSRKCIYNQSSLEFLGHVFGADGIKPSPQKIHAILDLPAPKNASEVRSLLGMTNFCGSRFVPDYATLTYELRCLTKKETPWRWTTIHDRALSTLKKALNDASSLAYFDPEKKTEIYVDASPVGLCAVLTQRNSDDKPPQVIQFASRALTPTEQRYSQTEREALAVTWGCEYFHIYLYGAPFKVFTDHKPLVSLFNNPMARLPPRIERWVMRMQPYTMNVVYRPGADNPADYLSRHPTQTDPSRREEKIAEEYIQYIMQTSTPKAMKIDEVATATMKDKTLKAVTDAITTGKWYVYKADPEIDTKTFNALEQCKSELSLARDGILLKGTRIVLPQELHQHAVDLAHSGHQGIVKTLALMREKIWFYGMHKAVEKKITNCLLCQISTPSSTREPFKMSPLPETVWSELSADFGQLPNGEYLLVITDEYSRYVVVDILTSISARAVIPRLDKVFAEFGIPNTLKTDNGPPFSSYEFQRYAEFTGFKHRKITPLWPRANAETERFMRTIKKTVKGAIAQNLNWKQEMYKFLLAYRATPHTTTGVAPATVMFQRNFKTLLPEISTDHPCDTEMRKRDEQMKNKMRENADTKNYVKPCDLKIGDPVFVKDTNIARSKTPFKPTPLIISDKKGSMITAKRGEKQVTRNSSFFKRAPRSPTSMEIERGIADIEIEPCTQNETERPISPNHPQREPPMNQQREPPMNNPQREQRQRRQHRPPKRYKDYVMK